MKPVHFEVSSFRRVIVANSAWCAPGPAQRKFAYGPMDGSHGLLRLAPHRADYSEGDAQAVCDMLNEREKAALAVDPLDGKHRVSPPSACQDGGASGGYAHYAARFLVANETY